MEAAGVELPPMNNCEECDTRLCPFCGDCPECGDCDCEEETVSGGFDADELGLDPEDDAEYERRQRG
jgi:hypothetical protein